MIFGWLKRRKMERDELAELRDFADAMEGVLDNIDLLQRLQDEEQIEIDASHFWTPEYVKGAFRNGSDRWTAAYYALPWRQKVSMPEPETKVETYKLHEHRQVRLAYTMALSDQDILLRRTPAQMMDLAHRVARDLEQAVAEKLCQYAGQPLWKTRQDIRV